MFFYVVSRTYAEIFSLLRICSGLLSNSPGLYNIFCIVMTSKFVMTFIYVNNISVCLCRSATAIYKIKVCEI